MDLPVAPIGGTYPINHQTERRPAMVYDKKKSGDPDYDDKVPLDAHAGGKVVKSEDGRDVFVSDSLGPIDAAGAHVSLDGPTAEDLDNRPAPGGQATESSTVQTYEPEDTAPGRQEPISVKQYRAEQAKANEPAPAAEDAKVEQPAKTSRTSTK